MVKMQTDLKNFSVAQNIVQLFSGFQLYDLKIECGKVLPDVVACPLCSTPLSKNGYNTCRNRRVKVFGLSLKKGKLVCPNSQCGFSLSIPQTVFDQWIFQFEDWLESIIISLRTKKMSSGDIARHIKETFPVSFSDEYVRLKAQELIEGIEQPLPMHEPSGVIAHDEQFVAVKGVDLKRISTVDANNSNVYYDKLHSDRTEETTISICEKLKECVGNFYAAVLDGSQAAITAYQKVFVGILIQYCLFHFAKNVRDAYKEEVGYGKGRSILPLQHLIGFFSILNVFFDHERELNQLRHIQKELNEHRNRINSSNYSLEKKQEYIDDYEKYFASKASRYLRKVHRAHRRKNGLKLTLRTEEQARELLNKAKLENVFPKKVRKQINRLENEWENFTHCMRDTSIPPTSNKVEQYYAITLNWIQKNNLQSQEQFYQDQKISIIRRYGISLFKPGIFTQFLNTTLTLLFAFGGT